MIHDVADQCSCPVCRMMSGVKASGAGQHFRNARRELLLAIRSLIDSRLERLEPKDAQSDEPARKIEIG